MSNKCVDKVRLIATVRVLMTLDKRSEILTIYSDEREEKEQRKKKKNKSNDRWYKGRAGRGDNFVPAANVSLAVAKVLCQRASCEADLSIGNEE